MALPAPVPILAGMSRDTFLSLCLANRFNVEILRRLDVMPPGTWLTSGCLVQPVWNRNAGRVADADIADYDLIYLDPDRSWEAEDRVIRRAADLFADLPIRVQVRNQARVPIWYREKFGIPYPPVREAQHAVLRFPSKTTAIALTRGPGGEPVLYAPFGVGNALRGRVVPNHRLNIPSVYAEKTGRWTTIWPDLVVQPW